jgi:hypothetical protein
LVLVVLLWRPVVVVDLLRRSVVMVELPWRERLLLLRRERAAEEDGWEPRMGAASRDMELAVDHEESGGAQPYARGRL